MNNEDLENVVFMKRQRLVYIVGSYLRMGFAFLILFAMIGNCSGKHDLAIAMFVITAVVWACLRIVAEGIDSYVNLRYMRRIEEAIKTQKLPPPSDDHPTT